MIDADSKPLDSFLSKVEHSVQILASMRTSTASVNSLGNVLTAQDLVRSQDFTLLKPGCIERGQKVAHRSNRPRLEFTHARKGAKPWILVHVGGRL